MENVAHIAARHPLGTWITCPGCTARCHCAHTDDCAHCAVAYGEIDLTFAQVSEVQV